MTKIPSNSSKEQKINLLPTSKLTTYDGVPVNQSMNTFPYFGLSSPIFVSSHPIAAGFNVGFEWLPWTWHCLYVYNNSKAGNLTHLISTFEIQKEVTITCSQSPLPRAPLFYGHPSVYHPEVHMPIIFLIFQLLMWKFNF